jgi:hypothetical protein
VQAALGDLVIGMQVWVQNLLPLACGKGSTPVLRDIALQFAERYETGNSCESHFLSLMSKFFFFGNFYNRFFFLMHILFLVFQSTWPLFVLDQNALFSTYFV